MSTLCLTGWQQPHDALANIAPDAEHFAYADYESVADCFAHLPKEVDLAIGWSLGGQLLARAIATKQIKARRLLLLGAPFQFLAGLIIPHGMKSDMFTGVINNYRSDPEGMLEGFCGVIAAGDTHAARITRTLRQSVSVWKNAMFWLKELGRYSCSELAFGAFPPTIIVHGDNDKVIYPEQAPLFAERILGAKLHRMENCGHAPHLHDPEAIKALLHV